MTTNIKRRTLMKVVLISSNHTVAYHTCAVRAYDQCNKDAKTKDELCGIVDTRGPALASYCCCRCVTGSQHALAHAHHPILLRTRVLHCTAHLSS
jgi:hypothetical protein